MKRYHFDPFNKDNIIQIILIHADNVIIKYNRRFTHYYDMKIALPKEEIYAYEGFESKQFLEICFYHDRVHFIYEISMTADYL